MSMDSEKYDIMSYGIDRMLLKDEVIGTKTIAIISTKRELQFSSTIGFTFLHDLPDFMVYGLTKATATKMFKVLFKLYQSGRTLEKYKMYDNIFKSHTIWFIDTDTECLNDPDINLLEIKWKLKRHKTKQKK